MNQDEQKEAVAVAAVEIIERVFAPDLVIGVGTGSTADRFIDALALHRDRFAGAVASSERSAGRLAARAIRVFELNNVEVVAVYVDGADEVTDELAMIKGGGGALTREKIVAAAARRFICIADQSKLVRCLGAFPLPIEVIPMARAQVTRALVALGQTQGLHDTTVRLRAHRDGSPTITDNGNCILDVSGWTIADPRALEGSLGAIVGVVESGLFALRPADVLLLGTPDGVRTIDRSADALHRGHETKLSRQTSSL